MNLRRGAAADLRVGGAAATTGAGLLWVGGARRVAVVVAAGLRAGTALDPRIPAEIGNG